MQEFNPQSFVSLPLEMQEGIIAQRPDLIRNFSQVNPEYDVLLQHQYLTQVCERPVYRNELDQVMNKLPVLASLNKKEFQNGFGYVLYVGRTIKPFGDMDMMEVTVNDNQDVNVNRLNHQEYYERYFHTQSENDLLLQYYIWTNRLKCINQNSNYAKTRTLSKLEEHWNSYNSFLSQDLNLTYYNHIIHMYMYMFMNKIVFNIPDSSDLMKLENIPQNIDDIKHDIQYLYQTIKQRITVL